MRINRETMSKRIYHIVDVVGEATKMPILIIKAYKISVRESIYSKVLIKQRQNYNQTIK